VHCTLVPCGVSLLRRRRLPAAVSHSYRGAATTPRSSQSRATAVKLSVPPENATVDQVSRRTTTARYERHVDFYGARDIAPIFRPSPIPLPLYLHSRRCFSSDQLNTRAIWTRAIKLNAPPTVVHCRPLRSSVMMAHNTMRRRRGHIHLVKYDSQYARHMWTGVNAHRS